MANIGDAAVSQGDIMRRLRDLERAVRELTAARRLESASIGAGGLRIFGGGSLTVEGGGNVDVSEGSVRILDADGEFLANVVPVGFDAKDGTDTEFGISTTPTTKATATLQVPTWAGGGEMFMFAAGRTAAINTRAVSDFLWNSIDSPELGINGFPLYSQIEPSKFGTITTTESRLVPIPADKGGATIQAELRVWTNGGAWDSHPSNICQISAIAVFRRLS